MAKDSTFSGKVVEALRNAKILGVRSGTEHRYIGVWVVVVDDRVFVRSWNDKPTGWFRALKKEPAGMIQFGDREVRVLGKAVRREVQHEGFPCVGGRFRRAGKSSQHT
jgi:hypothetical protein